MSDKKNSSNQEKDRTKTPAKEVDSPSLPVKSQFSLDWSNTEQRGKK